MDSLSLTYHVHIIKGWNFEIQWYSTIKDIPMHAHAFSFIHIRSLKYIYIICMYTYSYKKPTSTSTMAFWYPTSPSRFFVPALLAFNPPTWWGSCCSSKLLPPATNQSSFGWCVSLCQCWKVKHSTANSIHKAPHGISLYKLDSQHGSG